MNIDKNVPIPFADMPVMPKNDKNAAKRMLACKHEWLTLADQPLYKCVHCGLFMRIEK